MLRRSSRFSLRRVWLRGRPSSAQRPYCSRIVHWNLPRNPVDIEQREGRVHRYKDHAVRRNVVAAFSATPLAAQSRQSPWVSMFEAAQADEVSKGHSGDIILFWIYQGNHKIERVVLIPPFSREKEPYKDLITSLATYRRDRSIVWGVFLFGQWDASALGQRWRQICIGASQLKQLIRWEKSTGRSFLLRRISTS